MASKQADSDRSEVDVANEAAVAFGRAFTNGEIEAFLALLAPEVAFEVPSVMADSVLTLSGHEEVRDYLERTTGEYEQLRVESNELRDQGSGRFLMLGSWHAKPRRSSTRFGTPFGAVLDIREGKVTRLRAFFDEQLAIDAARRD